MSHKRLKHQLSKDKAFYISNITEIVKNTRLRNEKNSKNSLGNKKVNI